MITTTKVFTCTNCGREYSANREKRNRLCEKCSLDKMHEVATQMFNHQGPYYDKWLKSMRNSAGRASEGIMRFLDE